MSETKCLFFFTSVSQWTPVTTGGKVINDQDFLPMEISAWNREPIPGHLFHFKYYWCILINATIPQADEFLSL